MITSLDEIRGSTIRVHDIYEVPYDNLHLVGVRKLIFDFDGTLGHRFHLPTHKVCQTLKELESHFSILVVSNNMFLYKVRKEFFAQYKIPYIRALKPLFFEKGFIQKGEDAVFIGDTFLTDAIYAKRLQLPCFLIRRSAHYHE